MKQINFNWLVDEPTASNPNAETFATAGSTGTPALSVGDAQATEPVSLLDELKLGVLLSEGQLRALFQLFLDKLQNGSSLARNGTSYCEKSILEEAGIPYGFFVSDPVIRETIARFAPRFPIAEGRSAGREAGKHTKKKLMFLVCAKFDELQQNGIAIKRYAKRPSNADLGWLADQIGWPRHVIKNNSAILAELRDRLADGRLQLGEVHHDVPRLTLADRRRVRTAVSAVLWHHRESNVPIPAHPERADKIYWAKLLDEAGVEDAVERDEMQTDKPLRKLLTETISLVGLAPASAAAAKPDVMTYGDAIAKAEDLIREEYRVAHPMLRAHSDQESRSLANELSFLRRLQKANERELDDGVLADLKSPAARDAALTDSRKGNMALLASLDRWIMRVEALTRSTSYPATFAGALEAAMHAAGTNTKKLAEATGAPPRLINNFRNGRTMPTYANEHFVPLIEAALQLVPGTLTSRVPVTRNGKNTSGRTHITLSNGRTVRLRKYWRFLPKGACAYSDERLRAAVEDADARHFPTGGAHYVRTRASFANAYGLPEPDPSCPIYQEFEDLRQFKQNLADYDRLLPVKLIWTDDTAEIKRQATRTFERFLRMPVENGGCGLQSSQVSFALILNDHIVLKYIAWRINRGAQLLDDGRPIGPRIAATERDIVAFFSSLLDEDFGWIPQSEELLRPSASVPNMVRIPRIISNKDKLEIVEDEKCRTSEVLPQSLLDMPWKDACQASRTRLSVLRGHLDVRFKVLRDPQAPILPILKHPYPLAVVLRMVREALKRTRPIETAQVYHALDYQRIVAMLMLMTVVFRSETLRSITFRADGSGQIRRGPAGYEFKVEADEFKNGASEILFGPTWRRRDYERELEDWGGLSGIIDHYIANCRPVLLDGRESDLLFPPPKGRTEWEASNFNHMVKTFTREFCVYNKRTGTGMEGVKAFGPHCCRDIVATNVLKHCAEETRWERAAFLLGTGVKQVKQRYGWLSASEELAKNNPMYGKAFELAGTDQPLW